MNKWLTQKQIGILLIIAGFIFSFVVGFGAGRKSAVNYYEGVFQMMGIKHGKVAVP